MIKGIEIKFEILLMGGGKIQVKKEYHCQIRKEYERYGKRKLTNVWEY